MEGKGEQQHSAVCTTQCRRCCRVKLNKNYWSWLYIVIVLIIHAYLLYQGSYRYTVYRTILPKTSLLNLISLIVSASITPLICFIAILRLHSYSSDGLQVGHVMLHRELASTPKVPLCTRLKRGAPPISSTIHVIIAALLLVSDKLTVYEGKMRGLLTDEGSISDNFLSFGDINVTPLASSIHNVTLPQTLPSSDYEMTNVILSLVVYSAQSAYIFWSSNIVFTVLFSSQLLLTAILHIISYLGFSALYLELVQESRNKQLMPELQSEYLLDSGLCLFLFLLGNAVLFFSSMCVLHFGYGVVLHRVENILKCQGYLKRISTSAACSVYAPHFLALVSIVLYIGITTPLMYDYITVYTISSNRIFILHIIFSVLYMLFWTILWLLFTVKQDWLFHVNEMVIKRYAVIQHQTRNYSYSSDRTTPTSNLRLSPQQTSNHTTSHNNNSRNGDHKVQFQSATKIFIETEHYSDVDEVQAANGHYNFHNSPSLPYDNNNFTPRSNTSVVSSSYVIDLSQYSPTSSNEPDWMDRSTSTAV